MFKSLLPDLNFSEAHVDFDKAKADPEMVKAVERSAAPWRDSQDLASEIGLPTEIRAKYKIELTFGPKRTVNGPNRVGIQVWESGKKFHGGGDELMFFCKDNRAGQDAGCWSVIPGDSIRNGIAFCSHCNMAINADYLTNMSIGFVSSKFLSEELTKLFHRLGSNADIYIKYHKTDMRYQAMAKAKGEDVAARLKGMHIYPLKNILKDTSNGASVSGRFYAFVTS